jgi:hypothetical protein
METVIAIGVLAVLLTGFIVVFTPAADGIRKTISTQQADRLTSALEQELVTLRGDEKNLFKIGFNEATGFNKAYTFIKESNVATEALLVYQYRGDLEADRRDDGTLKPIKSVEGKLPAKDYSVVPMARRLSDDLLLGEPSNPGDLDAVEGPVYLVKCTQLVYNANQLILGEPGQIKDPKDGTAANTNTADEYPEAVIAFAAEFHPMPTNAAGYFTGPEFAKKFAKAKTPVFTRNLAVRR